MVQCERIEAPGMGTVNFNIPTQAQAEIIQDITIFFIMSDKALSKQGSHHANMSII